MKNDQREWRGWNKTEQSEQEARMGRKEATLPSRTIRYLPRDVPPYNEVEIYAKSLAFWRQLVTSVVPMNSAKGVE